MADKPTFTKTSIREIVDEIEKKHPTTEPKPWRFSNGREFKDHQPTYGWARGEE